VSCYAYQVSYKDRLSHSKDNRRDIPTYIDTTYTQTQQGDIISLRLFF
jgi:hypothetical protein